MTVRERLEALRQEMKKRNIGAYLVTMADFHHSEYVGDYFMEVRYISGFTGTNATVVVTEKEAGLWTDGRYFIQANKELEGTTVKLYKMAVEGEPTVNEFLEEKLPEGMNIGFDGRCIMESQARELERIASAKNGKLSGSEDLIDLFWEDRPAMAKSEIWELKKEFSGVTVEEKLTWLRGEMKKQSAQGHILSSLCDIAWVLNMRADDIPSVPVFLSFLYVTDQACTLYVQEDALKAETRDYLEENHIAIRPYDSVYEDMAKVSEKNILFDPNETSMRMVRSLPEGVHFAEDANPSTYQKAIKNPVEIENTKKAHVEDAVAMIHFLYWLDQNKEKKSMQNDGPLTEIEASDYLADLRAKAPDFIELSFETIAAYGPNAAMMHYEPTREKYSAIQPKSFLLVDSGGTYMSGTTDITRTITMGPLTDEEKHAYTTVLRSNLRLAAAHFPDGCVGQNLDILARGPVWDEGLDYRCGTGHGVGHISNVHEGPNAFRWKVPDRGHAWVLKPGMITTNEPGLYVEDGYGIRIENELLCVEDQKTEYGQFYKFETLTYVPIDLRPVIVEELTYLEKKTLNEYHAMVFDTMKEYFTGDELEWLRQATREI
ncbi:MAG: aminopeptidase P family protein [Lachnospiraceae bacterium]|jgi:Xaa-Pro aminopeptidase|nr:aminopeptidase P family protein [Lachnospiraceae bacterium]